MKKISEPSFTEECAPSTIKKELDEKRTDNCAFMDEDCTLSLNMHEYFECTFTRITFHGDMNKMEFADVIFEHCDLSNIEMQECVFRRVIFRHCRLMGCDMSSCQFHDVVMDSCQGGYLNLNGANLHDVAVKECVFTEASFAMMKIKDFRIKECDFTSSEWMDTKMKDLDFSDSIIDGIAVNPENLRGVIVNSEQAVAMAKLLGICIK
jgi:uncharacterized protein YjbI with pentapeptide repeats